MFARYPNYAANIGTGLTTSPFAAGTLHDTIVSNIDLAPTLLHLATGDSTTSAEMDGLSLVDEVTRQGEDSGGSGGGGGSRVIFSELNKNRAAISTKWKYIRLGLEKYADGAKYCQDPGVAIQAASYPGKSEMEQLYDLINDGGEQKNIARVEEGGKSEMQGALECHLKKTKIGSDDYSTKCEGVSPDGSSSGAGRGEALGRAAIIASLVATAWCFAAGN